MIKAGYGITLVRRDAVHGSLKRQEIGRAYIEGIDIVRPVVVCKRANDLEENRTVDAFLQMKGIGPFTTPAANQKSACF
ncbi:LysR family transcriptional regulator [Bacillus safensis FO-36b] [Bacillus safensis subsp. safensis]